ncbi:hypothetical protein [Nocardioides sp. R-C-SC26]|uniref:hypothetical protein n=1 Tax=Nocardioides sp. R-C-SC26 TaxID=2870414 RepID=UPI001E2AFEA9|nr:hypothetical protein [Nocardioides sp. R-C-SC26]
MTRNRPSEIIPPLPPGDVAPDLRPDPTTDPTTGGAAGDEHTEVPDVPDVPDPAEGAEATPQQPAAAQVAAQAKPIEPGGAHVLVRNAATGGEWACPIPYLPTALERGWHLAETATDSAAGAPDGI